MLIKLSERALCASLASILAATMSTAAYASPSQVRTQAAVGGSGPVGPALLPTGQYISALLAPGSSFQRLSTGLRPDYTGDAAGAMTTVLSPDGTKLLVLTSGYNANIYKTTGTQITVPYLDPTTGQPSTVTKPSTAWNWVFLFDVTGGKTPKQLQAIPLPDTFEGITWSPDGTKFYVSGGEDDRVYVYGNAGGTFVPDAPFVILNHDANGSAPKPMYNGGIGSTTAAGKSPGGQAHGLNFGAETAGVAVSADGTRLYAANLQNDSISIIDAKTRKVLSDFHLYQPGMLAPQGEYPFWITPHAGAGGATDKLYISSIRDGQVISLATTGTGRIIYLGGEPGKMLLTGDGTRLYVANPDLDEIDQIDTATDTLTHRISVAARPGYRYRGTMPNSLALTPNGATLYATLGGENAVAVIDVRTGTVRGRIPTGWYPTSVTISPDGGKLYIVNTKSNAGPNPSNAKTTPYGASTDKTFIDEYDYALEKGGIETVPIPDSSTLPYLSAIVDANNNLYRPAHDRMMGFLRTKIKHIIYIQKENRTYDQVLGDLRQGNGDPRLALFPESVTPNQHQLARQFVDLDNFYTSSDVSGDGWNWTEQGHANDYTDKYIPLNYSSGAFTYDANGTVRNLNPASPYISSDPLNRERLTALLDPSGASTFLPGDKDPSANEGADNDNPMQTGGYIWDSVLRAGLTIRHYGEYDDQTWYSPGAPFYIPIVRDAYTKGVIEGYPLKQALAVQGRTDPYFRGWDLNEPDEYRFEEWNREFKAMTAKGVCSMPNFESLLLMMDHTGDYYNPMTGTGNVAHLETPDQEQSSNDHSVGLVIDALSHSPCWPSTAVFIIEDDSQNGPDHVDAHRSIGFVVSPWVRTNSLVHTNYNTTSMLRTIEDILGVEPLGLQDATAEPMSDVFTMQPNLQPYSMIIPGALCVPPVLSTLVPACFNPGARKSQPYIPLHAGAWWAQQSEADHLVWNGPDKNDPAVYNQLLWTGMMGDKPYPGEIGTSSATRDSDGAE
jgi:YVTN family beta-propeller protein